MSLKSSSRVPPCLNISLDNIWKYHILVYRVTPTPLQTSLLLPLFLVVPSTLYISVISLLAYLFSTATETDLWSEPFCAKHCKCRSALFQLQFLIFPSNEVKPRKRKQICGKQEKTAATQYSPERETLFSTYELLQGIKQTNSFPNCFFKLQ